MRGAEFGVAVSVVAALVAFSTAQSVKSCQQILAEGGDENQNRALLCQLSESSSLLAQLGVLVTEGLDRLLVSQGIALEEEAPSVDVAGGVAKRKHEYLRFGKRKHEYLRFGKRKHEYLRFGRK